MFGQAAATPAGPSRGSSRKPRASQRERQSRGGIQKKSGPARVDKDGDLVMDAVEGKGGRGVRGAQGRGSTPRGGSSTGRGPRQGTFSGAGIQRALAQAGAANVRSSSGRIGTRGAVEEATGRSQRGRRNGMDEIEVKGLKQSEAANNPDGGISDLRRWLEQKANRHVTVDAEKVRIRKVCLPIADHPNPTGKRNRLQRRFAFVSCQDQERRPIKILMQPSRHPDWIPLSFMIC